MKCDNQANRYQILASHTSPAIFENNIYIYRALRDVAEVDDVSHMFRHRLGKRQSDVLARRQHLSQLPIVVAGTTTEVDHARFPHVRLGRYLRPIRRL